jgi:hypothetical protein
VTFGVPKRPRFSSSIAGDESTATNRDARGASRRLHDRGLPEPPLVERRTTIVRTTAEPESLVFRGALVVVANLLREQTIDLLGHASDLVIDIVTTSDPS